MHDAPHIGILYESDEWSDHKLAHELRKSVNCRTGKPADVRLINTEDEDALQQALACDFLVSRVFASALFRNHNASHARMDKIILAADKAQIPLINQGRAHGFEVSKYASTTALSEAGIKVPLIHALGTPNELLLKIGSFDFPCIIKPDCGGRTTYTAILQNAAEAHDFLATAPTIPFIVEEYITPEKGFMTRIEIIGGKPELITKRSVASNGLSSYHFGCTYKAYPDCSKALLDQAKLAAHTLDFIFGSFDVIETKNGAFFIDANSVSNVSEDCTELLGMDLMARYAETLAKLILKKGW